MRCQPTKPGATTINVLPLDAELLEELISAHADYGHDAMGLTTLHLPASAVNDAQLTCFSTLKAMMEIKKKMHAGSKFETATGFEKCVNQIVSSIG